MSDPVPAPQSVLTGNEEFHYCVTPTDGEPETRSFPTLEAMLPSLHQSMQSHGSGWVAVFVKGKLCHVSSPIQTFKLRMPDGNFVDIKSSTPEVFDSTGKFSVLRPTSP